MRFRCFLFSAFLASCASKSNNEVPIELLQFSQNEAEVATAVFPRAFNDCIVFGYVALGRELESEGQPRPTGEEIFRVCETRFRSEISAFNFSKFGITRTSFLEQARAEATLFADSIEDFDEVFSN